MIVLGAYVKVANKRYRAGFAWIDDLTLKGEDSFAAPADQTEDDQLRELLMRAEGVIDEVKPDLFVLRTAEIQGKAPATIAHRAEGVVLAAAAGPEALAVLMRSRQKLARHAGSQKNAVIVERLCGELNTEPGNPECREAAAAAVGGLKDSG
jgi:hypothetical protein